MQTPHTHLHRVEAGFKPTALEVWGKCAFSHVIYYSFNSFIHFFELFPEKSHVNEPWVKKREVYMKYQAISTLEMLCFEVCVENAGCFESIHILYDNLKTCYQWTVEAHSSFLDLNVEASLITSMTYKSNYRHDRLLQNKKDISVHIYYLKLMSRLQ